MVSYRMLTVVAESGRVFIFDLQWSNVFVCNYIITGYVIIYE